MPEVPEIRIRKTNGAPLRQGGRFVLYWMTAFRRLSWNFSLDRAVYWARKLQKPLIILEALRCDYPWASDRLHAFILDGMAEHSQSLANSPVHYYPYAEPGHNKGTGLLHAISQNACLIVTDDYPCFFLPRMLSSVSQRMPVRVEAIDSNGLLPMCAADQVFKTAYAFRRFLQKTLPEHLGRAPKAAPLVSADIPAQGPLPGDILEKWPPLSLDTAGPWDDFLSQFPLDHKIRPAVLRGGTGEALTTWKTFLGRRLHQYEDAASRVDKPGTSGLSPYLHFGHISSHQLFHDIRRKEKWNPRRLASLPEGRRSGWWGMHPGTEAFLDQLITWRELGFNMCWQRDDYDSFESLPEWAATTLAAHARDPRPHLYDQDALESATTHDRLWNAAQTQLVREGTLHGYLRMLWGKKILEWSSKPRKALDIMLNFNNKYALDGRDPNSYSGVFWILGRYDRAWGPERDIFGKVRYMSSQNTARKMRVKEYIAKYTP